MNQELTHPFSEDDAPSVYRELKELEAEVRVAADDCRTKGLEAINAENDYDKCKHDTLLRLYAEEAGSETVDDKGKRIQLIKRTEMERAVIYRTQYYSERLAMMLAKRAYEVSKDYVKSLQSVLTSTQARAKLIQPSRYD